MYRNALKNDISMSELNHLRSQGLSNKEIAQRVGASASTINRYLPSMRKSRAKLSDGDRKDILLLWKSGEAVTDIANSYECNLTTIYKILRDNGINLRSRKHEESKAIVEPEEDIPTDPTRSTLFQQRTVSVYSGRLGEYVIDWDKKKLLIQPEIKKFDKAFLFDYIRDLMIVWREL